MAITKLLFLIFLSLNLNFSYGEENAAMKFCRLNNDNLPGYCKNYRDCPSVYNEIRRGFRSYTVCNVPNQPPRTMYICCPDSSAVDPNEKPPKNYYPLTRKYQKKCKEYQDAAYEYIETSPLPNQPSTTIKRNKCGHKVKPLVIGGEKAAPREFPHMASIGFIKKIKNDDNTTTKITKWKCGGSLISERYVLTAAHCFKDHVNIPKVVRIGELDFASTEEEADPVDILIEKLIPHPDYNKFSYYNDIGLIKLSEDVEINPWRRPACLPSFPISDKTNKTIGTGWGATNISMFSEHLLKVTLEKFTYDRCTEIYKQAMTEKLSDGVRNDTQICYGSHSERKDTCYGDSGGPLQSYVTHEEINCMYEIVAVTSFGIICGRSGIPAIYTKVYEYVDWIENIVWAD